LLRFPDHTQLDIHPLTYPHINTHKQTHILGLLCTSDQSAAEAANYTTHTHTHTKR